MLLDTFQQELDNLVAGMLDLGRQVEASLENMVRAMEEHDAGLAGKELGVDARYKVRGADIDNKTMVLQARQAPVARDRQPVKIVYDGVQEQPGTLSTLPYTFPFP